MLGGACATVEPESASAWVAKHSARTPATLVGGNDNTYYTHCPHCPHCLHCFQCPCCPHCPQWPHLGSDLLCLSTAARIPDLMISRASVGRNLWPGGRASPQDTESQQSRGSAGHSVSQQQRTEHEPMFRQGEICNFIKQQIMLRKETHSSLCTEVSDKNSRSCWMCSFFLSGRNGSISVAFCYWPFPFSPAGMI